MKSSEGWSRDDAFGMLDESVSRYQLYQWLQRMAVMAPLVGVLITAFGLRALKPPDGAESSLSKILDVVTPLFSGVIVGASLALINQILLQIVQWQIEKLRTTAQGWFDREVWIRVTSAPRNAVETTLVALDELQLSIRKSAKMHQANAIRVRRISKAVVRAGLASEKAFRGFGTGLAEFSAQIKTLQKATESTRQLAESMAPALRQANESLTSTAKGFHDVVHQQFIPAARNHGESARISLEMIGKTHSILTGIDETTQKLQTQGGQLVATTNELGRSSEELRNSIKINLVPAQESLRDVAGNLNEAAQTIPTVLGNSAKILSSSAEQLQATLKDDLTRAVTQLHETIKVDLAPMAAEQRKVMQDASKVAEGLESLFQAIQSSSGVLEERYGRLADSANQQSLASKEIYDSLKTGLVPAQKKLSASVAGLTDSTQILTRFLKDGVEPATARLGELSQVIGPMQEAAAAIGELGSIKGELRDLEQIIQKVRQAIDSAKALADLRSIIEQLSASFEKADELRSTVAEIPELFGKQIHEMSNQAMRRQADELKETLFDIAKQFHLFAPIDQNGTAGSSR